MFRLNQKLFSSIVLNNPPPNYESYDYSKEWVGMRLNDLAEKAVIRSLIRRGGKALELGGGFGRITKILEPYFDEVVMIDFSNRNIRKASDQLSPHITSLVKTDIRNLPCKNDLFDLVVMVRIAHHLAKPAQVLDEICRTGKDRATVIISLPNPLLWQGRTSHPVLIRRGNFEHEIYSTPFNAYSHHSLVLLQRRGTGLFENFIGRKFNSLSHLHLLDVISSPAWFLKKNLFLKFEIRK